MRLQGGRTGKRALTCTGLELTGLMHPFDFEVWYGGPDRGARVEWLRQVALPPPARCGRQRSQPRACARHRDGDRSRCRTPVSRPWVRGCVRAGLRRIGAARTLRGGRCWRFFTEATSTVPGMPREDASRALARYKLAHAAEQTFDSLSGGQQARLQILLLELGGGDDAAAR